MKRICLFSLTLALLVSLAACGGPGAADTTDAPVSTTAATEAPVETTVPTEVEIGGVTYPLDTTELSLDAPTFQELDSLLSQLPQLKTVTIADTSAENQAQILGLMKTYPNVSLIFDFTVNGVTLNSMDETADFSNMEIMDLEGLEDVLANMPKLTKVEMHNCGIGDEYMGQLNDRHENIRFIWTLDVDGYPLRTDATWFMPVRMGIYPDDEDMAKLKYCVDMEGVDIGHIGIISNLDWAAYMPKLRFLIFVETSITDLTPLTGLPGLEYLEMFINPIQDLAPLATLKNLKHLNLCYVRCEGDVDVICQMPWLERLWWKVYMDPVSPEDQAKIREALPNTECNFYAMEATSDGWRTHDIYFEMRDFFGMDYMN